MGSATPLVLGTVIWSVSATLSESGPATMRARWPLKLENVVDISIVSIGSRRS
jgi:hypothetical protein